MIFGRKGESGLRAQLESHRGSLLRVALSWCNERSTAEDLVQETMVTALANSHQLRDVQKARSWLLSILHNSWRQHLRRARPMQNLDDLCLATELGPPQIVACQQLSEKIQAAVALLPVAQRQVMTLVDLEDCTYAEVAEIMDTPIGTVMSRLSRARDRLKGILIAQEVKRMPGGCNDE
jgi:RNA polymerase sigma-70 factor (ECF subfamily)